MLTRAELGSSLDGLEADAAAARPVHIGRLVSAAVAAGHWARESRQTGPLKRLAKVCRAIGEHTLGLAQLETAYAIDGNERSTVMGLTAALDEAGQTDRAAEVIEPLLQGERPEPVVVARAAALAKKLGRQERSLELRRLAARLDRAQLPALLAELTMTERNDEALAVAREAIAEGVTDVELAFRCYVAVSRGVRDQPEIAAGRAAFERAAAAHPDGALWRARFHRRENRLPDAIAEVRAGLEARPDDPALRRELAWCVLAEGQWGRDAAILAECRPYAAPMPELRNAIAEADGMLRAFGGSLEAAAANPSAFAHIRTPGSVFDHVVDTAPARAGDGRQGVVMIGASLAAGGAERVLATCFSNIKDDPRFGWAKLYLLDLSPETAKDFYLPLTGLRRDEVVLLNRECRVEPPLSWLAGRGRIAQCILTQLLKDKPAVVHAWLEPLDALAGLAAIMAGVPRVILHTHNMRPGDLNPEDTFVPHLRECYRALLRRPEVSLVCCADAGARDYAEWIGLSDRSSLVTLHNGFNADDIVSAGNPETTAKLRVMRGYTHENVVVGTAFRFSNVKRPERWVEAAELVLARHPECRFLMFGDGELRTATQELIRAKGLSEFFILPGLVSDLYRRLPVLDLFVLSSRSEALPNVLLEAQAAGVPVVAYDVGGVAETMIDGVTGLLVKVDTAEALAAGILQALADPEWRRRASEAGQVFVKQEFSVERMIANLSNILLHRPSAVPAANTRTTNTAA